MIHKSSNQVETNRNKFAKEYNGSDTYCLFVRGMNREMIKHELKEKIKAGKYEYLISRII